MSESLVHSPVQVQELLLRDNRVTDVQPLLNVGLNTDCFAQLQVLDLSNNPLNANATHSLAMYLTAAPAASALVCTRFFFSPLLFSCSFTYQWAYF